MGVLLIFSAYAWFSTALNVQVRTFNMVVTRNSGLTISLDGINYDSFVEISKTILIDELKNTYPNNLSQWAANGMIPVSTNGIPNSDTYFFDIYSSSGVRYKNKAREVGFLSTIREREEYRRSFNNWIAFDLFLKNDTFQIIYIWILVLVLLLIRKKFLKRCKVLLILQDLVLQE